MIDTRAPAAHVAYRIRGSVNIAIPSLILKRCRKMTASGMLRGGGSDSNPSPNVGSGGLQTGGGKGGFQNMEALRQFVVGEKAKGEWSAMLQSILRTEEEGADMLIWDGDVIVYDEEMEQDVAGTAWTLMDVLMPLVNRHGGRVDYLEGGIMKGVKDAELKKLVDFGPMGGSMEEPSIVSVSTFVPSLLTIGVSSSRSREGKSSLQAGCSNLTPRKNHQISKFRRHHHPHLHRYLPILPILQAQFRSRYPVRRCRLYPLLLPLQTLHQYRIAIMIPPLQRRQYRCM